MRMRLFLVAAGVGLLTCGCLDPRFTRYPTLTTNHPAAENKAYEYHDPFPDPSIGPETYSRPRGYTDPRAAPRKAAEQRLLNGLRQSPETIPPVPFSNAQRYSGALRQ